MIGMRKKLFCVVCAILLVLGFSGCSFGMIPIADDRKSDTVVFIPLDPEEAESLPETNPVQQEITEAPTEPIVDATTPETVAPPTQQHPGGGQSDSQPSQTEPPATESPESVPTESVPEPTQYDISGYVTGALEQQIFAQINALRTEQNLPTLLLDGRLCAIASVRAWELQTLWSHTRPNGSGFSTIGADYGYGGYITAENLYYNDAQPAAEDVVQGWMNGAAQRDNILAAGHVVVGIGVYWNNGYCYIACLFVG